MEQLIDPEQTAALGLLLKYAIEKLADDRRTVADIIEILSGQLEQNGLSSCPEVLIFPVAMPCQDSRKSIPVLIVIGGNKQLKKDTQKSCIIISRYLFIKIRGLM